jgi:TP901-1 family phage major tail protein
MAANLGRTITLGWGSPPVAVEGLREKGIEMNGEPIDISSDDDAGWRRLLAVPGENQVNISLSGVSKNRVLQTDWFAGNRLKTAEITLDDGATLEGSFFLASFSLTGTYNEAIVFEASLQSSGPIVYTPAA